MDKEIVVSIKTILVFFLLLVVGVVAVKIYPVLLALFVSLLLSLIFTPPIDLAQKKGIPRPVSSAVLYVILITLIATVGITAIKPITSQTDTLLQSLPQFIEKSVGTSRLFNPSFENTLTDQLTSTSERLMTTTLGFFSNTFFLISILVFTFYLLVEFDEIKRLFILAFPGRMRKEAHLLVASTEEVLGAYVRGQLLLGLIVGMMTYVGLTLLNLQFALPLAIFAGVLEMLPMIGPILSAIPALIVAIPAGPWMVVGIALLYTLIQQTENNLLVPKVMQKTVGLNPLVTLIILMTGGSLFGLPGIILAIPTTLVLYLVLVIFFNDLFELETKWLKNHSPKSAERE